MAGVFDFVTFAGKTDVGRKRKNNEDNFGMFPEIGVWLVADGMGGGDDGEVASAAVVRAVSGFAEAHPFPVGGAVPADVLVSGIADAVDAASQWIYNRAQERKLKCCASTVVGVALDRTSPGKAVAFHAGDSRLYLIRGGGFFGGGIRQVTCDHSAAEAMGVKEKSKLNPMWMNVITRAVGLHKNTDIEYTPFNVKKGDRILICSDGLSGMVPDKGLLAISKDEADVSKAVEKLIAAANEAGGKDNVTAVLVEIGDLPKADVSVASLKEIAVGEGHGQDSDGATRPTCETLGFESLTRETAATAASAEAAAGDDPYDNGEPRSGCLDKRELERLSGQFGRNPQDSERRGVKALLAKYGRRRLALWAGAAAAVVFMLVAVAMKGGSSQNGAATAEPARPPAAGTAPKPAPTPKPVPTPKPAAEVPPVPVPSVATNGVIAELRGNGGSDVSPLPPPNVGSVPPGTHSPGGTASVPSASNGAGNAPAVETPTVDTTFEELAAAFERKPLSVFEGAVKNALRQSGEDGQRAVSEFSFEMRKVSARAAKFVAEAKYMKGSSRSAEDLIVDFKYALEKAAVLKAKLDAPLSSAWNTVADGDVKKAETRRAVISLVSGLAEALK